jgi:hypothetical protein
MKPLPLILGGLLVVSLAACDDDERGRIYSSRDEEACKTLLFTCAPGRQPFYDDDGCGCELINDEDLEQARGWDPLENDRETDRITPVYPDENTRQRDTDENTDDEDIFNEDPIERDLKKLKEQRLNVND